MSAAHETTRGRVYLEVGVTDSPGHRAGPGASGPSSVLL